MARADAQRNREKILEVARGAFAEPGGQDVSMAEIARRAGVGMATLYRNFPGRFELLEALYTDQVDAVVAAADGDFTAWVRRFVDFSANKHPLAMELLSHLDGDPTLLNAHRDRVLAAGRPLLEAAQARGEIRSDLTLEQVLDLVIAIGKIRGGAEYVEPILDAALDGIRKPG